MTVLQIDVAEAHPAAMTRRIVLLLGLVAAVARVRRPAAKVPPAKPKAKSAEGAAK